MNAQLVIQTEKSLYKAGDNITGSVKLNNLQQYEYQRIQRDQKKLDIRSASCNQQLYLYLTLTGQEEAVWLLEQDTQQQHTIDSKAKESTVFPKLDILELKRAPIEMLKKNPEQYYNKNYENFPKQCTFKDQDNRILKYDVQQGQHIIINQTIMLYEWTNGSIEKGQYQFPFQFLTDSQWPSSFAFRNSTAKAQITFQLDAFISDQENIQESIIFATNFLSIEQQVIGGQHTGKNQNNSDKEEEEEEEEEEMQAQESDGIDVCSWFCLHKGKVKLKQDYEQIQTSQKQEKSLVAKISIDNSKCSCAIQMVVTTLKREINFKRNQEESYVLREIIDCKNLGPVNALSKASDADALKSKLLIRDWCLQQKSLESNVERNDQAPTSTVGQLISCDYILETSCIMENYFGCFGDEPLDELQLRLGPLESQSNKMNSKKFVADAQWMPKTQTVKNIALHGMRGQASNGHQKIETQIVKINSQTKMKKSNAIEPESKFKLQNSFQNIAGSVQEIPNTLQEITLFQQNNSPNTQNKDDSLQFISTKWCSNEQEKQNQSLVPTTDIDKEHFSPERRDIRKQYKSDHVMQLKSISEGVLHNQSSNKLQPRIIQLDEFQDIISTNQEKQ